MLTSSMAWMGWTLSFLSEVWSFLSSVPEDLWTFLVLRRGVPLPLFQRGFSASALWIVETSLGDPACEREGGWCRMGMKVGWLRVGKGLGLWISGGIPCNNKSASI